MKYLKIGSLHVLSLLLFAPAALADVTCELRPSSQRIRMESQYEMLGTPTRPLTVLYMSGPAAGGTLDGTGVNDGGLVLADAADTPAVDNRSTFDLELQFSGDVVNDDDMPVELLLNEGVADRAAVAIADGTALVTATDADGNRAPAPVATIGRDSVYWEGIPFPQDWAGDPRGTFTITGIYIDASTIGDERLEVTVDMAGEGLDQTSAAVLTTETGPVSVARVDQALSVMFDDDVDNNKANDAINACQPEKFTRTFVFEEGFRDAWADGNNILLTVSSGTISAEDKGIFDVTAQGGAGELIIDVAPTSGDDTTSLAIEFAPAEGEVGDDLILTAELLPMRQSDESFVVSDSVDVGTYVTCVGDKLFFPFVTSTSGWDTGIVVINDSEVDGSCSLNWRNLKLDDDETAALSTIDVDAKDYQTLVLSSQRGDYQGSVGVQCTFKSATGYVFLSDMDNGYGQGYLVNPQ